MVLMLDKTEQVAADEWQRRRAESLLIAMVDMAETYADICDAAASQRNPIVMRDTLRRMSNMLRDLKTSMVKQ